MSMQYYLGVDVGSSKTHAMVANQLGQVCGFGEAGPGNHEGVGYAGLEAALQGAVGAALRQAGLSAGDIYGAGFGVSGFDWPCEREDTLNSIATLGLTCPVEAVNDAILGLLAGAKAGWGIAVVGGTGCNCWGWDQQHRIGHVTGAGGMMGEFAGAYQIIEEAIACISRAWSLRGPATRLTEAFVGQVGAVDQEDLIEGLVMERYSVSARMAHLVFEVAQAGDPVACEVITWAGEALADLAIGVIRQLALEDLRFDVVLVGSLYNGGLLLIDPMRQAIQRVAPGAILVRLKAPPVTGGVLLGMQQAGVDTSTMHDRLSTSAREFSMASVG